MKAQEILKKLSWSMTLPFGVAVRNAYNLIDDMKTSKKLTYDGPGRFLPDAWYLEISSRYENLCMMDEFSTPDVVCRSNNGSMQYFLIEN